MRHAREQGVNVVYAEKFDAEAIVEGFRSGSYGYQEPTQVDFLRDGKVISRLVIGEDSGEPRDAAH